jgi:hypothetical protein
MYRSRAPVSTWNFLGRLTSHVSGFPGIPAFAKSGLCRLLREFGAEEAYRVSPHVALTSESIVYTVSSESIFSGHRQAPATGSSDG